MAPSADRSSPPGCCAGRAGGRAFPCGRPSGWRASSLARDQGRLDGLGLLRRRHEDLLEIVQPGGAPQFGGRAVQHDATARQHDDAVGQRRDLLHDVARQQDAAALVAHAAHQVAHRPAGRRRRARWSARRA